MRPSYCVDSNARCTNPVRYYRLGLGKSMRSSENYRRLKTFNAAAFFVFPLLFVSGKACATDYELRAGYASATTSQGGLNNSDTIVADGMRGLVLSAIMQTPSGLLDFGLRFEQLSSSTAGNRDLTFRTLGLVFEKEFRYRGFFIAPEVVINFLNNAHYSSGGTELWRANSVFTAGFGGALGYRFRGVGIAFNLAYRSAQLNRVFNSSSGSVGPEAIGGKPDFSGLSLGLGLSVLL
jgi:hypothetical protein